MNKVMERGRGGLTYNEFQIVSRSNSRPSSVNPIPYVRCNRVMKSVHRQTSNLSIKISSLIILQNDYVNNGFNNKIESKNYIPRLSLHIATCESYNLIASHYRVFVTFISNYLNRASLMNIHKPTYHKISR